jgi:hypothetical protein
VPALEVRRSAEVKTTSGPDRGRPTRAPHEGPKLLDRVRSAIRLRHYSTRTEAAYVGWIRRYIHFHGIRHPDEMGSAEVVAFLSDLALQGSVAASAPSAAGRARTG